MSIKSVMPSNHLILCHPLLLLPPITPSIRVFSNESTLLMRWPKYWSFSFSIIPFKEVPGLISFTMDWLDLAVQETLKSLLQHPQFKSINSSALSCLYGPALTSIHLILWLPLLLLPQYFTASGSFSTSQLYASGGQSIGVSASTSVLPMKTED